MSLLQATFDDRIMHEQVLTLFRQTPAAIIAHTIDATVLLILVWGVAPTTQLTSWFLLLLALGVLRTYATYRHKSLNPKPERWPFWARVHLAFAGTYALVWATAALFFLDPSEPFGFILIPVIVMGLTSGAATTQASYPPAFFLFSGIACGVTILVLVASGQPEAYAVAFLTLLMFVGTAFTCLNIHKVLKRSLHLSFENLELRREAERTNAAKTQFLAAASHDLRQPIHALGLFFSALSDRIREPEAKPLVSQIEVTIGVIGSMLDALLDISKLDAGVVRPNVGAVDLDELFARLRTELGASARQRGLSLRVRTCGCRVRTDPAMLERILRNLLSNALRYTRQGGVLLAARRRGAEVSCEVWDTGIGIASDHIDEVFLEFRQLGNPQRDRRQGLGLGLAIVKRLSRLLGHQLSVRSVPGRGSCFALRLPRIERTIEQAQTAFPTAESTWTPSTLRVLVLDDDSSVQQAMDCLLTGWGYQVASVGTLEDAEWSVQEAPPDLLVMDYRLPGDLTGAQAIGVLRERIGKDVPAVVITGDTAPDRLREAQASGFPLLHKPVQPARLRQTLRNLAAGT